MKNLSISKKLFVGFGLVLILFIFSVIASLVGLTQINGQVVKYARETVPNEESVKIIQVNMESASSSMLEAVLGDNIEYVKGSLDEVADHAAVMMAEIETLKNNHDREDIDADLAALEEILAKGPAVRADMSEKLLTGSEMEKKKAMRLYWDEYKPIIEAATAQIDIVAEKMVEDAANQRVQADRVALLIWILLIALAVVSVVLSGFIVVAIRKSILSPIQEIVTAYEAVARGSLETNIEYESEDEVGRMAVLIRESLNNQRILIEDVVQSLVKLSKGDLQIRMEVDYPGDYSIIKHAMEETVSSLNETLSMINIAAEQVSEGADSVSGGAQALASGSTEQAAAVEQLNASSVEVAKWAEDNVAQVKVTTKKLKETADKVGEGNRHMGRLTDAMADIGNASGQIAGITQVISDIAAQTNLLSLNAAIEAARAGEAGKGFAVVADEVRDLAAKSADAARKTIELIQNSVNSVEVGTKIAEETAKILKEVETDTYEVVEGVSKIQRISEDQSLAMEQIKQGLGEVSDVIETNAATAEENSATSEEMSAQAAVLSDEVAKFKFND